MTLRDSPTRGSIFVVDTFYYSVLQSLGLDRPLVTTDYDEAVRQALDFGFGTGGAYVRGLSGLGWDARISIANSLALQDLWARTHGRRSPIPVAWRYGPHLSRLPLGRNLLHKFPHLHGVLLDQIRESRPDVVLVQDLNLVPPGLARAIRRHTNLLVGEIASPLPPRRFLTSYDMIISALPTIVETAESWGIPARFLPLGFDERWADRTPASERPIDAIFVGSFSRLQPATAPLLREIGAAVPGLRIYGPASPEVLAEAGLTRFYVGEAWGRDMFALLAQSKLVVNRHGSVAGRYAVNMRMYETTGSGAALITERKSNLGELFDVGREVLAYGSPAEAAELAASLLADPERLDDVAAAGRRRTLGEHTYRHRAAALDEILLGAIGPGSRA
ncbi:glycosyltransferase family protein [Agromyces sp. NPDC055520]